MSRELPQALIRNPRIRECLAAKFGSTPSEISITQAGRISIPGRGTVVNNVDDFWSLLLGTTRIPRDPIFDDTAPYCMNCVSWGDKWIRDLCRECIDDRNRRPGSIVPVGPVATCQYFKPRPDVKTTPDPDPPAQAPRRPARNTKSRNKQGRKNGKART